MFRPSMIITLFLWCSLAAPSLSTLKASIAFEDENLSKLERFIYLFTRDYLIKFYGRQVVILSNDEHYLGLDLELFQSLPHYIGSYIDMTPNMRHIWRREYPAEGFVLLLVDDPSNEYFYDIFKYMRKNYLIRVLLVSVKPLSVDRIDEMSLLAHSQRINNFAVLQAESDGLKLSKDSGFGNCTRLLLETIDIEPDEEGAWLLKYSVFGVERVLDYKKCPVKVEILAGDLGAPGLVVEENGTINAIDSKIHVGSQLLLTIAEYLNFTPVIEPPQNQVFYSLPNGSYTGIIGRLLGGKSLLGIGKLYSTEEREKLVDFSDRYETDCLTWIVPALFENDDNLLLAEFSPLIWALVGLVLGLSTLFKYVFITSAPASVTAPEALLAAFMKTLAPILEQSATSHSNSLSEKLHFQFYLIYAIVITVAYKTSQARYLTLKHGHQTIQNEEDIVRLNMSVGGHPIFRKFLQSQNYNSRYIESLVDHFDGIEDAREGIQRVIEDRNFALLHYRSIAHKIKLELSREGRESDFYIFSECLLSHGVQFLVAKGHEILLHLNAAIGRLRELGLLDYWNTMEQFVNRRADVQPSSKAVTMSVLTSVFVLYLSGIVLASLSFAVELLLYEDRLRNRL